MPPTDNTSEDSIEISEKIRSGEFFRESRAMYDFTVHDPMTERYLLLFITAFSTIIFFIAFSAARGLYPLQVTTPFIVNNSNLVDDMPHIKSIISYKGEDASKAVLQFVLNNYVLLREEYNIDRFERSLSGVKSQSAENIFEEFSRQVDTGNPQSPIVLYQRHSVRKINIYSINPVKGDESSVDVLFEASVESKNEIKKSRWRANISFNYSGVEIDENTGTIKPFNFLVTQYKVKRVEDIK